MRHKEGTITVFFSIFYIIIGRKKAAIMFQIVLTNAVEKYLKIIIDGNFAAFVLSNLDVTF